MEEIQTSTSKLLRFTTHTKLDEIPRVEEVIEEFHCRDAFVNKTIKRIIVENNVKEIPPQAFSNFVALESISLPDGLKKISNKAFFYCKSLKEIVIPDTVEEIEEQAFSHCVSLVSITLPKGLKNKKINKKTFSGCSSLKDVVIPDDDITAVEEIDNEAFRNCTSLVSITFPSGLKTINWGAFMGCTSLKEVFIPNDTVEKIGGWAFVGCESLVTFTFPRTKGRLKKINDFTFWRCKSLQKVVIPDTVEEIGKRAFDGCESLVSIILPKGLKRIEDGVFTNCNELKLFGLISSRFDELMMTSDDDDDGSETWREMHEKISVQLVQECIGNGYLSNVDDPKSFAPFLGNNDVPFDLKFLVLENHNFDHPKQIMLMYEPIIEDLDRESVKDATVVFLMIKFYFYCAWIFSFMWTTYHHGQNNQAPASTVGLVWIIILSFVFVAFECYDFIIRKSHYFLEVSNWVDMAAIALSLSTGILFLMGRSLHEDEPTIRNIVTCAAWFLCLSFIEYLKLTLYKFAIFVEGVSRILWDLIPFAVTTGVVLLAFTHMYYIQSFGPLSADDDTIHTEDGSIIMSNGMKEPTSYRDAFQNVFGAFVSGPDNPSGILDYFFSIIMVIILLNVVIAIVSKSWEDAKDEGLHNFCKIRHELLRLIPEKLRKEAEKTHDDDDEDDDDDDDDDGEPILFDPKEKDKWERNSFVVNIIGLLLLSTDSDKKQCNAVVSFSMNVIRIIMFLLYSRDTNLLVGLISFGWGWTRPNRLLLFGISTTGTTKTTTKRLDKELSDENTRTNMENAKEENDIYLFENNKNYHHDKKVDSSDSTTPVTTTTITTSSRGNSLKTTIDQNNSDSDNKIGDGSLGDLSSEILLRLVKKTEKSLEETKILLKESQDANKDMKKALFEMETALNETRNFNMKMEIGLNETRNANREMEKALKRIEEALLATRPL